MQYLSFTPGEKVSSPLHPHIRHDTTLDLSLNSLATHLEAFPEWITQVLCDFVHANTSHCSHSQCPDERIGVFTILGESVDGENGQIGLRLSVVHEVEVDKLLELQVVCLHAVDHISKEGAGGGWRSGHDGRREVLQPDPPKRKGGTFFSNTVSFLGNVWLKAYKTSTHILNASYRNLSNFSLLSL